MEVLVFHLRPSRLLIDSEDVHNFMQVDEKHARLRSWILFIIVIYGQLITTVKREKERRIPYPCWSVRSTRTDKRHFKVHPSLIRAVVV